MPAPRLQLPTIQNWSCHNCSGCCRQHLIEITDGERRRIEAQNWTAADGVPANGPLVVWHAGPPWKKRYRLAHQSDGACVFLDERGLCRIHARFGEDAKPLACRIYPYAFHPSGKKEVAVSLRFSCPSVVANRGKALAENRGEIKRLADAVVPEGAIRTPPPAVSSRERLEWPDVLRIVRSLDATLAEPDVPVAVKLQRALFWIDLVAQARFDTVRGDRLADFLSLIMQAAAAEVPALPESMPPSRVGRLYFRMHAAQYARKDTAADLSGGLRNRWRLLRAALRFARGRGDVPPLQAGFRPVPFAALEEPFGGIPADAEELLTRYFRVKLAGLHFCGPAYYGVPLVEGFQSLALLLPAFLWLARWQAASDGRAQLAAADLARAVAVADHHHGYSPALGQWPTRRRVRALSRMGEINRLIAWYSR